MRTKIECIAQLHKIQDGLTVVSSSHFAVGLDFSDISTRLSEAVRLYQITANTESLLNRFEHGVDILTTSKYMVFADHRVAHKLMVESIERYTQESQVSCVTAVQD